MQDNINFTDAQWSISYDLGDFAPPSKDIKKETTDPKIDVSEVADNSITWEYEDEEYCSDDVAITTVGMHLKRILLIVLFAIGIYLGMVTIGGILMSLNTIYSSRIALILILFFITVFFY